jgi:hypothetical protein
MNTLRLTAALLAAALSLPALAGDRAAAAAPAPTAAALPAWDQLSAEQRELLLAPLRERWNASPQDRARMLEHARRWQQMAPEERSRARHGMRRFEQLNPEQRERARAIFAHTRDMAPEQRKAFMQQWEKMTPAQRGAWLREHPAPQRP